MPETSGGDDNKKKGLLARVLTEWVGKAIVGGMKDAVPGLQENTISGTGNPVSAFLGKKATELKRDVVEGLVEDEEVKAAVTQGVRLSVKDGISEVRKNVGGALKAVNEAIPSEGDARNNYQKMKDILGYKETDGFFTKLAKNVGARILSIGVPVLSFISAKVASRFAGEPENERSFRDQFDQLYGNLLGIMTRNPASAQ